MKTGGRLIKHARYYWPLLEESGLTRRLFGAMVRRIAALPAGTGKRMGWSSDIPQRAVRKQATSMELAGGVRLTFEPSDACAKVIQVEQMEIFRAADQYSRTKKGSMVLY